MPQESRQRIYNAVERVISATYPGKNHSLCMIYAIVGANVASVVLERTYKPVAGLSVIDSGAGYLIKLRDNTAFETGVGAYHCWNESADHQDPGEREVIDLTSKYNRQYALAHRFLWRKRSSPDFIWGLQRDVVFECQADSLPFNLPEGKIWVQESVQGDQWLAEHVQGHMDSYVKLTALALRSLR